MVLKNYCGKSIPGEISQKVKPGECRFLKDEQGNYANDEVWWIESPSDFSSQFLAGKTITRREF
jgi:hypothetical protein